MFETGNKKSQEGETGFTLLRERAISSPFALTLMRWKAILPTVCEF